MHKTPPGVKQPILAFWSIVLIIIVYTFGKGKKKAKNSKRSWLCPCRTFLKSSAIGGFNIFAF